MNILEQRSTNLEFESPLDRDNDFFVVHSCFRLIHYFNKGWIANYTIQARTGRYLHILTSPDGQKEKASKLLFTVSKKNWHVSYSN